MFIWKLGNRVIILCQWGRVRRWWIASRFRVTFVGITKSGWCWNFEVTMFGFRARFKPHFWWHVWSPAPRHCFQFQQQPCPLKHSPSSKHPITTTGRGLQLKIRRNNFPEAIKTFTQHLCCFQELFSWGGNGDGGVGHVLNFFSCWRSKRDTHTQK